MKRLFLVPFVLLLAMHSAHASSEAELISGFRATMMTPEYSGRGASRAAIRKFAGPVRFRVHSLSRLDRTRQARRFIDGLSARIHGLDAALADAAEKANFDVFIVDRVDYKSVVGAQIYKRAIARAPGRCVVTAFERKGKIQRSVAVIVADEGDAVFTRCLNEELSQGLGALDDNPAVSDSVFNGQSTPLRLTDYDIFLLNILYDPHIEPGMGWPRVLALLADVIAGLNARLHLP